MKWKQQVMSRRSALQASACSPGFAASCGAVQWAVPSNVSLPQLKSNAASGTASSWEAALEAVLAQVRGTSDATCPYTDVACAGTGWRDAADAVVLLMLASRSGGRFCTGAACLAGGSRAGCHAAPKRAKSEGDAQS